MEIFSFKGGCVKREKKINLQHFCGLKCQNCLVTLFTFFLCSQVTEAVYLCTFVSN